MGGARDEQSRWCDVTWCLVRRVVLGAKVVAMGEVVLLRHSVARVRGSTGGGKLQTMVS